MSSLDSDCEHLCKCLWACLFFMNLHLHVYTVSSTQALRAADLKKFNRNYLQLSVSMSASKYNQRLCVILTGHKWHRRKLYANTLNSFHQLTQRWVGEEFQTVNFIFLSFHLQRYIFLPVKLFLCIPCVSTFINFAPTLHLYPFVLQMVK